MLRAEVVIYPIGVALFDTLRLLLLQSFQFIRMRARLLCGNAGSKCGLIFFTTHAVHDDEDMVASLKLFVVQYPCNTRNQDEEADDFEIVPQPLRNGNDRLQNLHISCRIGGWGWKRSGAETPTGNPSPASIAIAPHARHDRSMARNRSVARPI